MTKPKSEKKLDLKVRRVLKTSVRGGVAKEIAVGAVGGGGIVMMSEEGASELAPGSKKSGSYGSRKEDGPVIALPELPGGGFAKSY